MSTISNVETTIPAHSLEVLIQELPADLRLEVRDFIEFLLAKRVRINKQSVRQDEADTLPTQLTTTPLRGTVLRYDDPCAPVAESEWEAMQ